MADEEKTEEESLRLDKKTTDILVTNIIPTSKYFEARFDLLQVQLDGVKNDLKDFKGDMDRRFELVDKRFEQVDKRFEQVDKRFEQVDKRFEQVDQRLVQIAASIDRMGDKLDYRDEKQRGFTIRMFTIAISISILGVLGAFLKALGIF